jgi:hypothetical protein
MSMIKPMFVVAVAIFAAPVLAQAPAPTLPACSAKVTDGCVQTPGQIARQMTGAQADARDARAGGQWAPNQRATTAPAKKAAAK